MTTHARNRVYIIAEAGVNHNGSLDMAKKLVDVAAEAGADAVKFQTFRSDLVVSHYAHKAEYQTRTTDVHESQLEMIRKLELSEADHDVLVTYAKVRGITFLSTPFDLPSLQMLTGRFGLETIKIPSGELTNAPFLIDIARLAQKVILSTGMATIGEVEAALSVLAFGFTQIHHSKPDREAFAHAFSSDSGQQALHQRVTLLHCTTEYPAPCDEVNLRAMDTLATAFGLPVGYSDHTAGIHIPIAAVARGAQIIEKHYTLNRNLPGPDHMASLEPSELQQMVTAIREVESALGDGIKRPTTSEWKNRNMARRSLVATREISKSEVFSTDNITCKRPGTGVSPMQWFDVLGRNAPAKYTKDDLIEF